MSASVPLLRATASLHPRIAANFFSNSRTSLPEETRVDSNACRINSLDSGGDLDGAEGDFDLLSQIIPFRRLRGFSGTSGAGAGLPGRYPLPFFE